MKKTLTLKNAIMVNNAEIRELEYDADEITAILFAEAESRRKSVVGKTSNTAQVAEMDTGLHLYMGFAAILAVNPALDFSDVERVHGVDLVDVMRIGRNFLLKLAESPDGSSAEPSGTTPAPILPAPKNSNGKE